MFYGAAEFSRDIDLAILLDDSNLAALETALAGLEAELIAVPTLDRNLLERGHAVHYRCHRADVADMRVDVMANLRGVPDFEALWHARVTIQTEGETVDLISLPHLVLAKKTQRDKDWPMIRRLVEQSYYSHPEPTEELVSFWLSELRTPNLLIEVASRFPGKAAACPREAARAAVRHDPIVVEEQLEAEEKRERAADREYWKPLREELEQLRHLGRLKPE